MVHGSLVGFSARIVSESGDIYKLLCTSLRGTSLDIGARYEVQITTLAMRPPVDPRVDQDFCHLDVKVAIFGTARLEVSILCPALMELGSQILAELRAQNRSLIAMSSTVSTLDQDIAAAVAAANAQTNVIQAAETLIASIPTMITNATQQALSQGATAAQLSAVLQVANTIAANTTGLAQSIANNTPAAPTSASGTPTVSGGAGGSTTTPAPTLVPAATVATGP